jgi:hypothetical protein
MESGTGSLAALANAIERVVKQFEAHDIFADKIREFGASYEAYTEASGEWSKRRAAHQSRILRQPVLQNKNKQPRGRKDWIFEAFPANSGPNGERCLNGGWFPPDLQQIKDPDFIYPLSAERLLSPRQRNGKRPLPPLSTVDKYVTLAAIHDFYGPEFGSLNPFDPAETLRIQRKVAKGEFVYSLEMQDGYAFAVLLGLLEKEPPQNPDHWRTILDTEIVPDIERTKKSTSQQSPLAGLLGMPVGGKYRDEPVEYVVRDRMGERKLVVPINEPPYSSSPYGIDSIIRSIEAHTRTRVKEGQNPCWFIRLHEHFKERSHPADDVSFAEFCLRYCPDKVDVLPRQSGDETRTQIAASKADPAIVERAAELIREASELRDKISANQMKTPLSTDEFVRLSGKLQSAIGLCGLIGSVPRTPDELISWIDKMRDIVGEINGAGKSKIRTYIDEVEKKVVALGESVLHWHGDHDITWHGLALSHCQNTVNQIFAAADIVHAVDVTTNKIVRFNSQVLRDNFSGVHTYLNELDRLQYSELLAGMKRELILFSHGQSRGDGQTISQLDLVSSNASGNEAYGAGAAAEMAGADRTGFDWVGPKSPSDWANKVFKISATTFRRRCRAGTIRVKQTTSKSIYIKRQDIPAGWQE